MCVRESELWSLYITLCQCLMHPDTHTSILISLSVRERQRESIVGFSPENWGSIVGLNRRCSDPWEFFNPRTKWLSLACEREGGRVSLWTVCKDPGPPHSPVFETLDCWHSHGSVWECALVAFTQPHLFTMPFPPLSGRTVRLFLSVCRRWGLNMFCFVRGQSVTHKGLLFTRDIWLLGE